MRRTDAVAAVVLALAAARPAAAGDAPAGDRARGAEAFEARCAACHALDSNERGPALRGVVGREAAAMAFPYTNALSASGLVWTRETLSRFLADPRALVPGTEMRARVPESAERDDLIAFLADPGR